MKAGTATSQTVIGVDGCPAGWLVVTLPGGCLQAAEARIAPTFADVLAAAGPSAIVAIDIPIGLPERSGVGGRPCDVAARANLGQRQSAVFAVPARAAVYAGDYAAACEAALAHSDPPRKVSKQCYNLFAKIREVDAQISPALQARVVECHPELAFWRLNGQAPLDLPKKVKSQPHAPGLQLRRALLESAGFPPRLLQDHPWRRAEAGPDDLLDACACAASAARIAAGDGMRFPAVPGCDPHGLRMEIWC